MKKLFSIVVVAALATSFASCGGDKAPAAAAETPAAGTPAAETPSVETQAAAETPSVETGTTTGH